MDKAEEMGKVSAVGSLQLFLGRSFSTVILAVGTIILGLFIAEADYGLYAIALIPATTFLLFQDWGVGTALTRYCAKFNATNDVVGQRKIMVAGLVFEAITGLVLTVVSVVTADFIASSVFGKPGSAFLIAVASVTIFMAALLSATNGIFIGLEKMKLVSYVAIIQAAFQGFLSPLLVFLGYGAMGAVLGFTIGLVASSLISLIILHLSILRKLPKHKTTFSDISESIKPLLKFGIPLAIGSILGGLLSQFISFLMAKYVTEAMIGTNKIASNFSMLLALISYPIMGVLFPAFSKLDPDKDKNLIKNVYASSVKYTVLFVVPATLALMVLAKPLIGTIYGAKWSYAPFLLNLSIVYNLLALFGWRSMGQFLPAMGETKLILKMNLLSLLISIPLGFVLVPTFGIVGTIITGVVAALPSTFIGIYLSWTRYNAKPDYRSSAKILIASALSAGAAYALLAFLHASNWILLVAGSTIFLAVYLISAPLVGAISQTDVNTLRAMFSGSGIVSKILDVALKVVERMLKIRNSS